MPTLSGEVRGSGDDTGAFGSEGFCGENSSIGSVVVLSSIRRVSSEIVLLIVPSPIFYLRFVIYERVFILFVGCTWIIYGMAVACCRRIET